MLPIGFQCSLLGAERNIHKRNSYCCNINNGSLFGALAAEVWKAVQITQEIKRQGEKRVKQRPSLSGGERGGWILCGSPPTSHPILCAWLSPAAYSVWFSWSYGTKNGVIITCRDRWAGLIIKMEFLISSVMMLEQHDTELQYLSIVSATRWIWNQIICKNILINDIKWDTRSLFTWIKTSCLGWACGLCCVLTCCQTEERARRHSWYLCINTPFTPFIFDDSDSESQSNSHSLQTHSHSTRDIIICFDL